MNENSTLEETVPGEAVGTARPIVSDAATVAMGKPTSTKKVYTPEGFPIAIPETYKACLELLGKVQFHLRNPALAPEIRQQILDLQKRYHALQQTPLAPEVFGIAGNKNHIVLEGELATVGQQKRAAELAQRLALQESDDFDAIPLLPNRPLDPLIIECLFTDEIFRSCVCLVRQAANLYAITFLQNWEAAHPGEFAKELKALIHSPAAAQDFETLKNLRDTLSGLVAMKDGRDVIKDHVREVGNKICHELGAGYNQLVKPTEINLLEFAITILEAHQSLAVEAEQKFFASHGIGHSPTAVSRRFDPVLTELRAQLANLKQPRGAGVGGLTAAARQPGGTCLEYIFGLSELPTAE